MPPLTPLVRADRYFAERDLDGLRVLAVVGVVTVAVVAVFYGMGWIVASHVDGTVVVDNPERPPDPICQDETDVYDQSGCDQPRTIERDVDSQIWAAWDGTVGQLLIAVPLTWLSVGILLHAGSWLMGSEDGLVHSFAVAAWGLVPMVVNSIVVLVILYITFDPITVTPATQDTVLESVQAPFQMLEPIWTIVTIVTVVWSAIIWRYGLEYKRGLSGPSAWLVAGIAAALFAGGVLV